MPVWLRSRGLERRSVRHPDLAWRAEAMLSALSLEDAELSILLCDDATIRKLNRRYRKINKATDVLAFPMQDGSGSEVHKGVLGDVVISLPTATRQARRRDRPIIEEVTFLLAHGLLHLLGHDHATAPEDREMTARTDALMQAVRASRGTAKPVEKRH
ncbi:MAG: rRNA maturation RNase YbeY [Deltaproteobacteria bacterium]|nr:rRNA maturation RNase YbeY [Deltaproteobacteria bacterium]